MSSLADSQGFSSLQSIRRLALATSIATGVLLVAGVTVKATGAGLACPDWPLCHGRLIPPRDALALIEYGHRLLASVVGLLMLVLTIQVWRHLRGQRRYARLALGLLFVLAAQIGLGGAAVLSDLIPAVVGTHLATAMAFLVLLVLLTATLSWDTEPRLDVPASPPALLRLAHLALVATFLQIVLGGFVSALGAGLACPDLPLCHGRLLPPAAPVATLHMAHRLQGVLVAIVVLGITVRAHSSRDRVVRAAATIAGILVLIQVTLGVFAVLTRLAIPVRIAHLAGAEGLLASLVVIIVRLRLATGVETLAHSQAISPARVRVSDYVSLMKPRIILLLLVTTFTTMLVAGGWSAALIAYTMLGGALAAGAANAINCYWDRDIDAVMRRTRGRPLPAGRMAPQRALAFGLALAGGSVLVLGLWVNWLSAALAGAGIVFYVGVYTIWLKRSTPHNIVIGGAAGAIPPLVGWAAATNHLGLPAFLLFAIVFLWTPPHFWALALYRCDDYRAAGVPMLPVVRGQAETVRQMLLYTAALIGVSLVLAAIGVLGRIYLISAVMLAVPLLALVLRLLRETTARRAWAVFEYSVLYLGLLFASMALDRLFG
jgi:protoheme IX farnesyltransferase